ncbi:radial spoke head 3 [Lamellibrachia satsuma]|nr:radial spoke head 3 [Lamellibrachia satsuma]
MTSSAAQSKTGGNYVYRSLPRAVGHRLKYCHYRDELNPDVPFYANIMFDPRVIRGNTYAMQSKLAVSSIPEKVEIERQLADERRTAMRRTPVKRRLRPITPEVVDERLFVPVRTSPYLQEIVDRKEEAQVGCQTDQFLDRTSSPSPGQMLTGLEDSRFSAYKPRKPGIDAQTQIYDGDLFQFKVEVRPMLEVLVGKTVEQALLEVMEEEELAELRSSQFSYLEIRNAELVEQQRLEEKEQLLRQEKERRIEEMRSVIVKQKQTAMKLAAHVFSMGYLADLVQTVFQSLTDNGFFYDPVVRDVELMFMPSLMNDVTERIEKLLFYRFFLDVMIREVVDCDSDVYTALEAWEKAGRPGRERKVQEDLEKLKRLKTKAKVAELPWWVKLPNLVSWWKEHKATGHVNPIPPNQRKLIPIILQKPKKQPPPPKMKKPSISSSTDSASHSAEDTD